MTRLRLAAAAATIACALPLAAAGTASAQEPVPFAQKVDVTGTNKGKDFTGTYTIRRFVSSGNRVYAVGRLTGTLKNRRVSRSGVRMPVQLNRPAQASQIPNPTPGACQVLNLTIPPIDLNLLGLRVATSRIELLIEAIPGQNALLGNLLCAITGLLDPQGQSAGVLSRVLNALLALAPRTA
jgi:hypothetical protein